MNDQNEVIEKLLNFARSEPAIRAVVLNGSLVNPNFVPDRFQDVDVTMFVRDLTPFIRRNAIMSQFGEIAILQTPEDWGDPRPADFNRFVYLTQYKDGSRIDLTFLPMYSIMGVVQDSLSKVILDKDNLIPPLNEPNESSYYPTPPTRYLFEDCCNEFWWLMPYIAKGIARAKPAYAQAHLSLARQQLLQMLVWQFGLLTRFQRNTGKFGRALPSVIGEETWQKFLDTYPASTTEGMTAAMYCQMDLFDETAKLVSDKTGFPYDRQPGLNVRELLTHY